MSDNNNKERIETIRELNNGLMQFKNLCNTLLEMCAPNLSKALESQSQGNQHNTP